MESGRKAHIETLETDNLHRNVTEMSQQPSPRELRVSRDRKTMTIVFDDLTAELSAEYLRVSSPSAEVTGHSPGERKTIGGKIGVTISEIEPVGAYAVRIVFSDAHATGIYTWVYLKELGVDQETRWSAYLAELEAKGLARDRLGER